MSNGGQTPRMGDAELVVARDLSLRGVRPPAKVPGYEQEQFLGQGAYGEVWVAVNRNSGRKVAIKFYTRRGGVDWSSLAREVEKLRYLFSDRYVVQLFEVGWESDPPYYVMEYMENGSLEDLLRQGPLSAHDAAGYFREIAVALVHAHNKGILHCDLKPANILLDHDRRPRLADFGQARLTNEMSPALGTLFYMAPEQADLAATPDARWDVYALGAVMYRMITGVPPHYQSKPLAEGNLEAQLAAYRKLILNAPKPTAHRRVPGVNAELASIIDRCLEPSPSKRYSSPHAVVAALDAWSLARVRRPLLYFTGIGFGLLLMMMAGVGAYLFWTTIATADHEVIERAMEANRFSARAEAQQMAIETEHRWRVLEFEAADPQLREWLASGDALATRPDAVAALDAWLTARREKYNHDFRKGGEASLWCALDRGGHMRGMSPAFPQSRNKYFGFRDYFTGLGYNSPVEHGPPERIITEPHRSIVYRRRTMKTWAVTFSVPVPAAEPGALPVGVLTMSIDLNSQVNPAQEDALARFPVLVDTRPDGNGKRGLIVRHPYMVAHHDTADATQLPLYYAEELVELAREQPPGWQRLTNYHDPVTGQQFDGDWLAAVERVVIREGHEQPLDTGFLIVVQERRSEVLEPVNDLKWRLGYGGTIAGAFLLLVLGAVWISVLSVLEGTPRSRMTRLLRRWAGLPTGTARSTTTGISLASVGSSGADVNVGGKTARVGAAATPLPPSEPESQESEPEDPESRFRSQESGGNLSGPPEDTPRD